MFKGREFTYKYNKDLNKNEYIIVCGCGTESRSPSKGLGAHFPPEMVARTFANKGWEIGGKDGEDVCPSCLSKRAQPGTMAVPKEGVRTANGTRPKEMEPAPPAQSAFASAVGPDPKAIERENRRKVFAKLSETYAGDSYKDGWSDGRIAMELGVPRKLVAEIRSQAFGDVATSPEMEAFKAESAKVVQLGVTLLAQAREVIEPALRIQAQIADLEKQLSAIETTRAAITKMGAI